MAANEIKLTLKVNDDNSLSIVGKKAKDAAAGVDKLDQSSKNLNKTQGKTYRNMQGVAGTSSNLTKNFSKMQQGIGGGLVPAYAALAARIFAVTAMFGVLQRASAVQQLEQGLIAVGNAAGQNLPYVADRLREISGLAVSTQQAMQATALATSAGFSTNQLEQLTKVAKGASLALGRDMGDALDRLVRGTAKLEPEILDELGIMVRLDDAVREYAVANSKAVDSLSQFERRQAFLNATIEQGTKKFDDIANVVEVNPYDKLAATFDDLSKTIINFGNKALAPIAEYLSSAPGALIGILALMGKTITNELTPALGEMAERAADTSEALAVQASKLQKETVKDYKKISKAIKGVDFAPETIKNAAEDYKKGSRSIAQMSKDVKALQISETSRETRLQKYRADGSGRSAEFIAQKEAEKASIVKLRTEIERLIAVEQGRGTGGVPGAQRAAANAQVAASQEGTVALGIGSMTGSIKNDFGQASKGVKNLASDVKNARGALGKLSSSFKVVTGGARLFGAAMGSLLGPLGWVITGAGLLWPILSKFFEKSASDKAMDEIKESFESFSTIAIRLNTVLAEEGVASFEAYYASAKVGVGVLNQIASGAQKAIEAANSKLKEELSEAESDIITYYKRIEAQEEKIQRLLAMGAPSQGTMITDLNNQLNTMKADLAGAEAGALGIASALAGFTKESRAAAAAVITLGINRLKATGLDKNLTAEIALYEKLKKKLKEGTISQQQFNKEMEEVDDRVASFTSGVQAAADGSSALSKAMQDLSKKPATEFSKIRDAARDVANELVTTSVQGEKGFLNNKGQAAQYDRMTASIQEAEEGQRLLAYQQEQGRKGITKTAATYQFYSDLIAENETKMLTANALSKEATEQAKKLKEFSGQNAFFMEQQISFERESTQQKINGLQASLKNLRLQDKTADIKAKIAKTDAEITALEAGLKDTYEEKNRVLQSGVKEQQRMNKALLKQHQLALSVLTAQDKLTRRRKEMNLAESGLTGGLNAADELAILEASAKARKDTEKAILEQKLIGIRLEYNLLDLQFQLEEQKGKNLIDSMKLSDPEKAKRKDDLSGVIGQLRLSAGASKDMAMQVAGLEYGVTIDPKNIKFGVGTGEKAGQAIVGNIDALTEGAVTANDLALALARMAASEEKRKSTLTGITALAEQARTAGNEDRALRLEAEAIEQRRLHLLGQHLGLMGDEIMQGSLDAAGKQRQLDIANQLMAVEKEAADNRIAMRAREVETAERLGGPVAGGFMALITGLQDLSEAGGVLAEKNEATLGQQVSAIKEKAAPLLDSLKEMGPEGAVMSSVISGALNMTEAFSSAFETIKTNGLKSSEGIQAGFQAAGAVISALAGIQKAKSTAAIAGIDKEIAAEKKRDGSSAKSIAKIKALEAKKEATKRKAFEQDKKMQMAQIVMSTASAVMQSFSNAGGFPLGMGTAAAMAAIGAVQLAMVASQSYQGGGSISSPTGGTPKSISMGQRSNVVDVSQRASGGELAYLRGQRGSGTNANNFTPAFYGSKKMRAAGGAVAGYTVGEQGPELFVPEVPGQIVPNDEIAPAQAINVNFNVQAIDSASFNDALTVQRGNIISIIREAANSSGEGFLETVDVGALQMEAASSITYKER